MAGEFGDHPDTAVARMSWALAMIQTAYPVSAVAPVPQVQVYVPGVMPRLLNVALLKVLRERFELQ